MGKQTLTVADYGGETSTVSLYTADYTAGTFATVDAALDDIRDAIDGVTIGVIRKDARLASEAVPATGLPASAFAQRETKWLVRARDDVNGKAVQFEIPCADLALLVAGTGLMDTSGGAGAALVTAVEANVKSVDGNAITVQDVLHVGRNL